jgi:hypothetical protein
MSKGGSSRVYSSVGVARDRFSRATPACLDPRDRPPAGDAGPVQRPKPFEPTRLARDDRRQDRRHVRLAPLEAWLAGRRPGHVSHSSRHDRDDADAGRTARRQEGPHLAGGPSGSGRRGSSRRRTTAGSGLAAGASGKLRSVLAQARCRGRRHGAISWTVVRALRDGAYRVRLTRR